VVLQAQVRGAVPGAYNLTPMRTSSLPDGPAKTIHGKFYRGALATLVVGMITVLGCGGGGSDGRNDNGGGATGPTPVYVFQTIVELTSARVMWGSILPGQSITIPRGPVGGPRFSWETSTNAGVRSWTALGHLYILTQEYTGLSRELGASSPGFVAVSNRVANNEYIFDDAVRLEAGAVYWFYADEVIENVLTSSRDVGDLLPGGDLYVAGSLPDSTYNRAWVTNRSDTIDANVRLRGFLPQ
jgi:hypothetical protein